jgi:hypothetical protein
VPPAGIQHEELLLRLKVHRSAAGIAEAICSKAADLAADAVIIASHGAGVMADFGSVARWASENSRVPALLLPPSTMDPGRVPTPPSKALVVAGSDNLEGLGDVFEWVLQKMAKPGGWPAPCWGLKRGGVACWLESFMGWACLLAAELLLEVPPHPSTPWIHKLTQVCAGPLLPFSGDEIYVLHAEQLASEEEGVAARKRLIQAVFGWQQRSSAAAAPSVNVVCDIIQGSSVPDESMADPEGESPAGAQICNLAAELNARCLILSHHGQSMMRELLWGHVTMHATKFSQQPLVVLEPRHVSRA